MLEYTIEVIMNNIMFCYNCSLIILFPLILKTLMKISERWTLSPEKGILHTLLFFCLTQSCNLYNSSRHSYRPDITRILGHRTKYGIDIWPGNENARANVLELITRTSAICTVENQTIDRTLLRNRSIYNLYTRFARSYKFTPAIKGIYRTLSFIYNCLLTSH